MLYGLLTIVLTFLVLTNSECPQKIKYTVKSVTKDYNYDSEQFENEVVSPEKDAFSITLDRNVSVLCKGVLNITKKTYHFYGYSRGIEEIQPGVFESQNLHSQLYLSNNYLTVIKKGTFRNLSVTELDLSYNKITTIEEGAIENMPLLSIIHLSWNNIKEFYPNSIVNTPKLLFFDMLYNKLEKLEEKHFSFMSIERNVGIGISSNELKEIHPKAFEGIDVFTLNLTDNKLKSIPKDVFSENKLHYLSIANNELTHLDDEFFKMDTRTLRNVEIEGNNFDEETKIKLVPFMEIIEKNRKEDSMIRFD